MPQIRFEFADAESLDVEAPFGDTILEAARRKGLSLSADCEVGDCQTCRARLLRGAVEYDEYATISLTEAEIESGEVLLCVASPEDDITIALPYERSRLLTPKPFSLKLTAVERLSETVVRLSGRITAIKPLRFFAGQYVNITVPGTTETRSYSMASAPSAANEVEFLVRLLDGGAMSDYVATRAAPGDILACEGPYGTFYLRESPAPLLMIAGGTGVAPMASMLRELVEAKSSRKVTLCFGVNRPQDLFYLDALDTLAAAFPHFTLRVAIAEGEAGPGRTAGYVTDCLEPDDIADAPDVYLCGPPAMTDAAHHVLARHGCNPERIYLERFVATESEAPAELAR